MTLRGGLRLFCPGSSSGLFSCIDWGGELEQELPVGRGAVLFAPWKPTYSNRGSEGFGRGWQYHIGSGVTFRF